MKLIEYNSKNCAGLTRSRNAASIHMHFKTGVISINRTAVEMLKISDSKSYLSIFRDEDSADWYLQVSRDPSGFKLRIKDESGTYSFNSVKICRLILQPISGKKLKSGSFKISTIPVNYNGFDIHLIITSDPLNFTFLEN